MKTYKKFMILSLLFGGMTSFDCFVVQNSVLRPKKYIDAYLGGKSFKELNEIDQNAGKKYLRIFIPRVYLANLGGKAFTDADVRTENTSEEINTCTNTLVRDVENILATYGINISSNKGALVENFREFFTRHSRRVVIVNPIPVRTATGVKEINKKMKSFFKDKYFWTEINLSDDVKLIVINYAKDNIVFANKGYGSGDISFIISGSRDAVKKLGLKYQIHRDDEGDYWNKFIDFARNDTGLDQSDFNKIVNVGLKNKENQAIKEGTGSFGVRMYQARYLNYLGMLNSNFGDAIFDTEILARGVNPVFFYHKFLQKTGEHIVAFYVEKNLVFNHNHLGSFKENPEALSITTAKVKLNGKEHGGKEIALWTKWVQSVGAVTPFEADKKGIDENGNATDYITFGKHKRENSVLYLVKISDAKFKEFGLDKPQELNNIANKMGGTTAGAKLKKFGSKIKEALTHGRDR